MALQDYARSTIYFNGTELKEVMSIDVATQGGWVPVRTLSKGLAGFSGTGGSVTIKVSFAVPLGGPEANFQKKCVQGEIVSLQVPIGGIDYIGNGKVLSVDFSQSTDKELIGSFDWMGEPSPME